MAKLFFYGLSILPKGFSFPVSYLQLAQQEARPDLAPWQFLFLDEQTSLHYYYAMLEKYPSGLLIPFAIINDESGFYNDGFVVLACFDGGDKCGDPKVYFHDYSISKQLDFPFEYHKANFTEWLQQAIEESANYKSALASPPSLCD